MARFLFRCIKFAHTFLTKIGKRDTANMMVNGHFFKGLNVLYHSGDSSQYSK